jgi:hypothetical protein
MPEDLEIFLYRYTALVLVNLWEQGCEASLYMDQLMRELERFSDIPVLRLTLTEYRDWARAHGIYGTPALVAYYQGRPLFRLMGRATPAELVQRLRQHGVDQL